MFSPVLTLLIAIAVVAVGSAFVAVRSRVGGAPSLGRAPGAGTGGGAARRPTRQRTTSLPIRGGKPLLGAIGPLPEGFTVAAGVSTPAGEIPAVVLGRTGLWALATTDATGVVGVVDGSVTVGGRLTDLASELWRRAHGLGDVMSFYLEGEVPVVQGALVFVSPGAVINRNEAMGVRLIPADELNETLVGSRVRLDPETLQDLSRALASFLGEAT